MDTGEFIAIEDSFTEANAAYRSKANQVLRLAKELIQRTVSIHKFYHDKAKGGWQKCDMLLCRRTQAFLETEGLEFD